MSYFHIQPELAQENILKSKDDEMNKMTRTDLTTILRRGFNVATTSCAQWAGGSRLTMLSHRGFTQYLFLAIFKEQRRNVFFLNLNTKEGDEPTLRKKGSYYVLLRPMW